MTPVPESAWQNYATDVWAEFIVCANQSEVRMMSPLEWITLRGWLMSGIPLRIVLRGFRETKGRGATLTYYDPAVRAAFAQWRLALSGAA